MRSLRVVMALVLTGLLFVLLAPQSVGGANAYVITHGISMEPRFHTGDLAVIRAADRYGIGDVAAYRSKTLNVVVMHRIVAIKGGNCTFKGDNNSWFDPEHPPTSELVGKLAVHIPEGGIWLTRLTSPAWLGLEALALLLSGGTAVHTQRRRRTGSMSRHTTSASRSSAGPLVAAPPEWRTFAAATGMVGILGLALAALAWVGPSTAMATTQAAANRSMVFSYSAEVPRTAAYDGTTVSSPDPVFRTVVSALDVHFAYRGVAGRVSVTAKLSTSSGWHTTIALAEPVAVAGDGSVSTVRLDLAALDARAQAATVATGMPADLLTIGVVPAVQSSGKSLFAPALNLTLSPQQLLLVGDAAALTVTDSATVTHRAAIARSLNLVGRSVAVATARVISVTLVGAALLAAALLLVFLRRTSPTSEGAEIRARYRPLLVAVEPMPTPPTRPVVDVTEFATLAKLAERYGLLVLHWSRSGVDTFVVQDEGTTYRYRPNHEAPPEPTGPAAGSILPSATL